MKRAGTKSTSGFTLVEVVISLAILGLIGVLVVGTFARAMDSRNRASHLTDHYHQVRQAMLRMSREIQMAYVSIHKNCEEAQSETLFRGKREGGGMRLDFTSFSHFKMRADANESDQNELSYYVDDDPENPGSTALFRREQAPIDDEPDEGGLAQVLAEGVTDLQFEFYDSKEDRWDDEWDTESSNYKENRIPRMPMFVKIEMKTKGPDGETEETFVTKTRIFLRRPIFVKGATLCLD